MNTTEIANTATTAIATMPARIFQAVDSLKKLGLTNREPDSAPIAGMIRQLAEIDETRTIVIARTLAQQEVFDTVVADQISQMNVGERFTEITNGFDSIREDAKRMVTQIADGQVGLTDRIVNIVMKVRRGDIADRFDVIRKIYLEVVKDVQEQIVREKAILDAYGEFRGALKEAEALAYEILETATKKLDEVKAAATVSADTLANATGVSQADRARLELARDEAIRLVKNEDDRYQLAKDLAENLRISYAATETTMTHLAQSHNAKDRIHKQAVMFFQTNTTVLSALKASFTGMAGLHEATKTLDAMRDGVSKSLETLADIGGKVQEAAIRSGYGPSVKAESVKKLVDSVVDFQERSVGIIDEMRQLSTTNANEIRDAVEGGKKRMAELALRGNALVVKA